MAQKEEETFAEEFSVPSSSERAVSTLVNYVNPSDLRRNINRLRDQAGLTITSVADGLRCAVGVAVGEKVGKDLIKAGLDESLASAIQSAIRTERDKSYALAISVQTAIQFIQDHKSEGYLSFAVFGYLPNAAKVVASCAALLHILSGLPGSMGRRERLMLEQPLDEPEIGLKVPGSIRLVSDDDGALETSGRRVLPETGSPYRSQTGGEDDESLFSDQQYTDPYQQSVLEALEALQ